MNKTFFHKLICIFWVLAHIFVFYILYAFRYSINDSNQAHRDWAHGSGNFHGTPLDYLKLYYSNVSDEAYYYEWSTLALGKSFENNYPFKERRGSPVEDYFSQKQERRLPYRDITFEYPPLFALFLIVIRLLSQDYLTFTHILAWILGSFYMASLWILYKIWKELPENQRFSWNYILGLSLLSILALGQLFVTRLDVIPSFLYLIAIYSFMKEKYFPSCIWIVLGIFTKGYSLLLAPLFGICLLIQKKYRPLLLSIFFIIFSFVGISLLLSQLTNGHYWDSYRFHASRGIQIESFYASIPYFFYITKLSHIFIYMSNGCVNIRFPFTYSLLSASKYLPLLVFGIFYLVFWKKSPKENQAPLNKAWLLNSSLMLVFCFLVTFKVLSPQFLIWLIPLIFLNPMMRKRSFQVLWMSTLILTQVIYPNFYWMLSDDVTREGVILILSRNILLLGVFLLLLKDWMRFGEQKE